MVSTAQKIINRKYKFNHLLKTMALIRQAEIEELGKIRDLFLEYCLFEYQTYPANQAWILNPNKNKGRYFEFMIYGNYLYANNLL